MDAARTLSPQTFPRLRVYQINTDTGPEALRATLGLIAKAIREGSEYIPIRQHAAKIATRAGPRDFLGQVKAIFDDFTRCRWRYVHDPLRKELLATTGPVIFGQVLGFEEKPPSRGYGDCDDATVAIGALAESIGLPTRIVTIAKPNSRKLFDHVFPQIKVPRVGWVSADPVVYPRQGVGYTAPYSRMAIWDTEGRFVGARGRFPRGIKRAFEQMKSTPVRGLFADIEEGASQMNGLSFDDFEDYGLETVGLAGTDNDEPADWSQDGLLSFGAYVDRPLPMINGDRIPLMVEQTADDTVGYASDGSALVRTKMMEMDPVELAYIYRTGTPRLGAVALSDEGDVYQWVEAPGLGGFFKRLFKRIKRGVGKVVKKVARGISRGARKLITKLPGGKYLVKVYDKVKRVGMKLVKPLMRIAGKLGAKLAPIAALIPGYGPAISVALKKVGKVDKILRDFGVFTDDKGRPRFKSGKQAKQVQAALEREAAKMKRKKRRRAPRGRRDPRLLYRGSPKYRARLQYYGLEGV